MELPSIAGIALYGAIALLNIINLGLLAYAVDDWSKYSNFFYRSWSPSSVNFMLFNTIWTFLVLVYLVLVPRVAAALYLSIVALPLLVITTVFWFAGSIALAAFLGVGNCDGGGFCSVYKAAQAATAFGFFIWIMLAVLLAFELRTFWRNGMKGQANADVPATQMNSQPQSEGPAQV
ncbi:hypothetical protein E4U43_006959 [Claviceps pusilla]|uniref:MARVEL domain-containing protein n=1 Tax=Claviceps pusilla TaxID=123648 RepID=A0A9P7N0G4_9HYPO|nr:hypothetical protein E4U43_006959 [Claviceps pusilla]